MRRLKKFSQGKSIKEERDTLAKLNENMTFKGGPKDKAYKSQVKEMTPVQLDWGNISPPDRRSHSLNLQVGKFGGMRALREEIKKENSLLSPISRVGKSQSPDLTVGGAETRTQKSFANMSDIEEESLGMKTSESIMTIARISLFNPAGKAAINQQAK